MKIYISFLLRTYKTYYSFKTPELFIPKTHNAFKNIFLTSFFSDIHKNTTMPYNFNTNTSQKPGKKIEIQF